ncbi:MAG: MFS transporter [Burkholderiales bacterium]|jgi:DHA2 family multidrug resistance protein-like MFS transporter
MTTSGTDTEGLPPSQRTWAVVTVALGITMAVLDSAIANVALPSIAKDLNATPADSIWVVNAYQLVITILMLPLASLGEIVGYRRVYRAGLVVFTLASLACALSHSLAMLSAARVLQGIGAAGMLSVNSALLRFIYPPRLLGRGIGINALVVAVSSAVGPTVAAGILSVASWPWLFAVNVPIGLATMATARMLPRTPRAGRRFDLASALLNALFFGLLIIAVDSVGHGGRMLYVALAFLGAAISGVALVLRQLPQVSPLLPVDLLRIPMFALSIATSVCSFAAQMLAYVAIPFYLQDLLGRSEVATGLLMTPWPLATAVMAPIAGRLADRHSAGILGALGLVVFAVGLASLALLPAAPGDADIIWRMMLCGAGFGLFQSPNNRAIITSAPHARSGGASGMLGTARLLGQTIGAALVALMFSLFGGRATVWALGLAAAIALLAAAVSYTRLIETSRAQD